MTTIDDLKKDNIFTESNNIRLRRLTGEDRSDFFRVLKAISSMPALYELDRVNELIWKEILSSDTVVAFAVEKKEQAVYVGNCMVKHPEAGILELGIDIAPEYQNQGIATEAMRLLVGKIRLLCPDQRLISRMYSDNDRSRHIILGLGGVKIAEEPAEYKEAAALSAAIYTAGGEKPSGTGAGENPAEPDGGEKPAGTDAGENPAVPDGGKKPAGPCAGENPAVPDGGKKPAGPCAGENPAEPDGGERTAGTEVRSESPSADRLKKTHIDVFEIRP